MLEPRATSAKQRRQALLMGLGGHHVLRKFDGMGIDDVYRRFICSGLANERYHSESSMLLTLCLITRVMYVTPAITQT